MAWRVVAIENPARLSVRDNQLVIAQEMESTLPIEDIDALILDNYGSTITTNLLTALATKGTTTVICDEKHLPASVLLPYSQHSRQAKVSRQQLSMSQPFKKQLWQQIIISKITNQADVLRSRGLDDSTLRSLANDVKSGDTSNRESIAARIYFDQILGDATRRKPIWHNAALNYGYAMVRSHIARHIATRGLVASQGLFHHNELNSFNLADDLIEPYRAVVDMYILENVAPHHTGDPDSSLTKHDRQLAIDILNYYVIMNGKKFTVRHSVERTVESFIECIETKEADKLLLPKIVLQ